MRIFVCILVLAVASAKASHESQSDAGQNSSPSGGFDHAPPHSFLGGSGGSHGGQTHDFSSSGPSHSYGAPSNDYTQANIHSFAPQSFNGGNGHAASASHDYNFPSIQQFSAHDAQPRGYDLSGHGDFSSSGSGNQGGDSYIKAVQDLGLNFGGHGGQNQGHAVQINEEENHDNQNFGHGGQSFGHGDQGGNNHQGFVLEDGGAQFGHGEEQNFIQHDEGQDFGHGQGFGHGQDFGHGQGFGHEQDFGQEHGHAIPVGEHTDTEIPVPVPQYKHVTYPIHKPIQVNVPKPILVGVPQPYPVKVPVHKPVAVPVETEISIPVEKIVPYPIVKNVPYPVEKHVPIKVEKTVTVHVPQPYPVKIPVYKTIHHHKY